MPQLTIDELRETREFRQLTPKQQNFVVEYVSNGYDATKAVRSCYNVLSDNNARSLSYTVLRSPSVQVVLSIFFGDDPAEIFLRELRHAIVRDKLSSDRIEALKLYAEVAGLRKRPAAMKPKDPEPEPEPQPGGKPTSLLEGF